MRLAPFIVALLTTACEGPISVVKVTTFGEAFIEDEIPASAFEDGWSVKFTKFLVVLKDAALADSMGTVGAQQAGAKAFDLTRKGPVEVFAATAPAKTWDVVRYAVGPDTNAAATNIADSDLALLKSRLASLIVIGSATKMGVTRTFEWSFTSNTLYDTCERADGTKGATLTPGKEVSLQLTLHGDHFFQDQLTGDAKLRFEAIANADGNNDNKVTLDELAVVQLTSLPQGQYGTGGATGIRNLKDFVTQAARSLGHFEGEGHCTPRAR